MLLWKYKRTKNTFLPCASANIPVYKIFLYSPLYSCSFCLLWSISPSLFIPCSNNSTFCRAVSCYCVMVLTHVQTAGRNGEFRCFSLDTIFFLFGCSHFSLNCSLYVIPVWTGDCSKLTRMRRITIPSGPAYCYSKISGGCENPPT